jgi:hypothetical protein
MTLQHRDRQWDYHDLRRGLPSAPGPSGLLAYQRDAIEWLFREMPPRSSWAPDDPIVLLPGGSGGQPGRLGTLVERLNGDNWRIRLDAVGAGVKDVPASALWSPRSDHAKAVLALCLAPGLGKTVVVAGYLAHLPAGTRAAILTATGLVEQTATDLNKWLLALGSNSEVSVVNTRKKWQQSQLAPRFVIASYAVARQKDGLFMARRNFDTVVFDEAHKVWKAIRRLLPANQGATWLRPYPRAVLCTGTPLPTTHIIDEVFYLTKSANTAAALGMPQVDLKLAQHEPAEPFFLADYMRAAMNYMHRRARGQGMATLWWAYHIQGYRWEPICNQTWYIRLLAEIHSRLEMALHAGPRHLAWWQAALEVQRSGLAWCLQELHKQGYGPQHWCWRRAIYEAKGYGDLSWNLPTPLSPGDSIATSQLLRKGPHAREWQDCHAVSSDGQVGGSAWASALNVLRTSLSTRAGEHPPQILCCLPHVNTKRGREKLLEELCNFPHRNKLCVNKENCSAPECRKCHDRSRFSQDGARLHRGYERYCFHYPGQNTRQGLIQDSPGLGATRIYLVTAEQKSDERSRSVAAFSRDCWAGICALSPLLAQMTQRPRANSFLQVLGIADVSVQLEALLVSPGLLLAVGDCLDVGFNLQQRATGLALTACEYDYDKLMQQCGRIQRIPRALAPQEAATLTVSMPATLHTIEHVILAPILVASAKALSG